MTALERKARQTRKARFFFAGFAAFAFLPGIACGGSGSLAGPTSGATLTFTAPPIDLSTIQQIVPLGNLNPPDHTLPTDHIYVNNRAFGGPQPAPQPVFAPGDGTVQFILRNGAESKIGVQTGPFIYYLDHVQLNASIRDGLSLTGGQQIGTTGTSARGIDLGVINNILTLAFANPARYPAESLHGDAPLKYFGEPLRSQMYAKVNRIGADKDGQFQFDIDGRRRRQLVSRGAGAGREREPRGVAAAARVRL